MQAKTLSALSAAALSLAAGLTVQAQSYSNAVVALSPVAYWPLTETAQPPFGAYIATNIGTAGAVANGFYQTWFQPWNTGTNTLYYQTNNIQHVAGAIGDGDSALQCTRSAAGAGGYVVFPRNSNGVLNDAITIRPPFSIEFWANPSSVTTAVMPIIGEGRNPSQQDASFGYTPTNWSGFCIGQYGTIFFFATWNGRGADTTKQELDTTLTQGVWQHMVVTFNGTNQTWFKNGVQVGTRTIPNSAANAQGQLYVPDLTTPLLIGTGSIIGAGNGGSEFAGNIDEVAIYTNILDPSVIANHYSAASATDATYKNTVLADNPTIYVRLNEPAFPSSGYPNPSSYPVANNYGSLGTAGNGFYQPGTVPGVNGPAFSGFGGASRAVAINGFSGAVDVGAGSLPTLLNPTGTSPMTVAAWFQANPADAPARFQEIVGHGNSSWRIAMDATAAGVRFNPGNGPELQFANSADIVTNGFLMNDGKWHFVAGVSDGANDYLYLDGVLAKSGTAVGAITGSTLDALLGGDPGFLVPVYNGGVSSQPRYFDGQIAHVAFFTNALSAAQIQQLYSAAGVPPTISLQPQTQTNNVGANLTLFAGVKGSQPFGYQWYKNSALLGGATSSNLTFNPLVLGNSGDYFVVVTNTYGSATSAVATLTVFGPPVLQQQSLTDVRVFVSANPKLQVTAAGPSLSYYWTRNGSPLADGTSSSYTVTNTATVGTATYGCTVSNANGTIPINPITVQVIAPPTAPYPQAVLASAPQAYFRLDESPDNGSGNNGTTAYDNAGGYNAVYTNAFIAQPGYNQSSEPTALAVEFGDYPPNNNLAENVPTYLNFGTPNGGNAQFSIEAWIDQYLYIGGGNGIVTLGYGNGGEQFVLDTGANGGAVRFFVRNAAGAACLANSSFVPTSNPGWHHLAGVCDEAGGQVRLYIDGTLAATGSITPGSGLLSSSMPIAIGARESANNNPVSYDYQFIGKIDEVAVYGRALTGTEVQNHYLASGTAPIVTSISPVNLTTNQGVSVVFTATATGTPPLTYQWYDPNSAPIGQNTNVLVLANVQPSQNGTYTLNVVNSFGTGSTNATLTVVGGPPNITTDVTPPAVTNWAGTPYMYFVIVDGTAPFTFQWKRNGANIAGATGSSYTFATLAGTNTYSVAVTNASGFALSASSINVGIPAPTLSPSNYTDNLKITFNGYTRSETLSDFPVLVRLGTNVNGFSYAHFASPTGGDLRFTDSSGTRVIPHEVDEWNPDGASLVWVQVPRLSSTNDSIYAYWGNPAETSPLAWSTNGGVWVPADFEGLPSYQVVYHLKESDMPFVDSTTFHTTTNGAAPIQTNGIVGIAGAFNGDRWLDAGTNDVGDLFTLSSWVNIPVGTADIQTTWANKQGGFSLDGFSFYVNTYQHTDQVLDFATGNGTSGNESTTAATVPFGSWHMISVAVDRPNHTAQFYIDGANVGSSTQIRADFTTLGDLRLGQFYNGAFDMKGAIDEARIQNGVNSSNWVWASWMTVASNSVFSSYSPVTSAVVKLNVQLIGGKLVLTWPQGTLQSAPAVTGTYTDMTGITSPYTNTVSGAQQFFRVRVR